MDESFLYQKVITSIRQDILKGNLKPGDRLPSIREMTHQWNCTPGTIQHAYAELANQGLTNSLTGKGTRVMNKPVEDHTPLRRAGLVHRAEGFLLEVLTSGYTETEVEQALQVALDRWRAVKPTVPTPSENILRFSGSHDLVVDWLAAQFPRLVSGYELSVHFTGSLGGLIGLAEGSAQLAGSHLWDEETDSYNVAFVQHLLPGRKVALVTLAHRNLGLILPSGNPMNLHTIQDLARADTNFANRQPGSGTRVWLESAFRKARISTDAIPGFANIKTTHAEVARAVAEGTANCGIGLEASARIFGLDFIFLTRERYDLVIPEDVMQISAVQSILEWLRLPSTHQSIALFGGYDPFQTGEVQWIIP